MRLHLASIGIGGIAALVIFAAGAGGAGAAGRTARTVAVVERTTAVGFVDNAPEGDSLGDFVVGASNLFNSRNRKIGTAQWMCVRTNLGIQRHCTLTYFFKRGLLTLQGPYRDDGTGTFAITGGTGLYRRARGWMDLTGTTTADEGRTFVYAERFHIIR